MTEITTTNNQALNVGDTFIIAGHFVALPRWKRPIEWLWDRTLRRVFGRSLFKREPIAYHITSVVSETCLTFEGDTK